ncbi:MAG: DoxX family protein [Candidatus Hinthialibacter antarcticus]|nr:DoxX family protein [Candidatus Hinthialibacter antarcticus]
MNRLKTILKTNDAASTIIIRVMVGSVFLSEGIQKFLYADSVGAGRFVKIGIPLPEIMGPFVGGMEILCGALLLLGLFTRAAALVLMLIMCVAIFSTKLPILLGSEFWIFSLKSLKRYGFWSMAHEARTDFCMLLGSLFLFIVGAGRRSLDFRFYNKMKNGNTDSREA